MLESTFPLLFMCFVSIFPLFFIITPPPLDWF